MTEPALGSSDGLAIFLQGAGEPSETNGDGKGVISEKGPKRGEDWVELGDSEPIGLRAGERVDFTLGVRKGRLEDICRKFVSGGSSGVVAKACFLVDS